jgi:hypothetical protein
MAIPQWVRVCRCAWWLVPQVLDEIKEKIRSDTFTAMKAESENCLQVGD